LDILKVFKRINLKAGECGLGKHIGIRPDAVDAEALPPQICTVAISFLARILLVIRFLLWPMIERPLAPPTIARMGAKPPMIPTSVSLPSTDAVPIGPEAMKTSLTSSPCFLNRPASLAIHMGAIEATGAV